MVDDGMDGRQAADEILIGALAQGLTHERAGALAGYSSKTVQRRLAEPAFAAAVAARRAARVDAIGGQLTELASAALGVLAECLERGKDADRLRAAHLVLGGVLHYRAAGELERRLGEVEGMLGLGGAVSTPEADA